MRQPGSQWSRQDRSDGSGDTRHYDSFVIRLWSDPAIERLLRAEVRHIQTDHTTHAVDVTPLELLAIILAHLDDNTEDGANTETQ
jgi:hypothetical protein